MRPRLAPLAALALASVSGLAAQSQAFATFGSALIASANFEQNGFTAAATCNGVNAGASWLLSPAQYDGWAVAGNTGGHNYCSWAFHGGPRTVAAIQLLNAYPLASQYGVHWLRHFALDYTTDPQPSLASAWQPLTSLAASVPGAAINGNVVVYPGSPGTPNLADLRITFAPEQATAIRLHAFPNGGTGQSDNFVITEVTFATTVPGFASHGAATTCSASLRLAVNGRPALGDAAFAWQSWAAPAGGLGVLFLATGVLPGPVPVLGIDVWIVPTQAVGLTVVSSSWGTAETPFPLPGTPGLAGVQVAGQAIWLEACAPQGFTASAAGVITLQ